MTDLADHPLPETPTHDDHQLVDVPAAAAIAGCSQDTIRRADDVLQPIRVGSAGRGGRGVRLYPRSTVEAWAAARTQRGAAR